MPRELQYDVAVLGGGIIGAAVLFELTRRGLRSVLVERGIVGQGCTAYSGGIVRVYHADDQLSEIAAESHAFYRDFEAHTGEPCAFTRTGFLYFPTPAAQASARARVARLSARVPMEWWTAERVRDAFPQIREPGAAVFEPQAGHVDAPDVARAFARAAMRGGACVFSGTNVHRLVRSGPRFVGVDTSQGLILADKTVVALGANTPGFLDRQGVAHALWPQRIQVDIRRGTPVRGEHPAWIDDVHDLNGRPHGSDAYLVGCPTHDTVFSDGFSWGTSSHSELIEHVGRRRFAWMDSTRRAGSFSSFDCYSRDGRGIVDFADAARSLAVVSGFSGGGVKLAPALAHRICTTLTES
jgi:glycine/D-amino acid oxidase-like deaminating enzyme